MCVCWLRIYPKCPGYFHFRNGVDVVVMVVSDEACYRRDEMLAPLRDLIRTSGSHWTVEFSWRTKSVLAATTVTRWEKKTPELYESRLPEDGIDSL